MEVQLYETEPNLIVFTAADTEAKRNLPRSLTGPIPPKLVQKHFGDNAVDIHSLRDGPKGGFFAWGAVQGKANNRTWNLLKPGDIVLTAYDGAYWYISTALAKFKAPEFAAELWGYADKEETQTWELMYFLSEPMRLKNGIPYTELDDYLRSGYRGFTSIGSVSGNMLEKIYDDFQSLEQFCEKRLLGYVPAKVRPVFYPEDDEVLRDSFDSSNKEDARKKVLRSIHQRRGQRKFRSSLLNAYKQTCAISREQCPAVLEAAHVSPYRGEHTNHIQNGLLLRADIHTLFDLGMITVDAYSYEVRVSNKLSGTAYEALHGDKILLPDSTGLFPSVESLEEHNKLFDEINR